MLTLDFIYSLGENGNVTENEIDTFNDYENITIEFKDITGVNKKLSL